MHLLNKITMKNLKLNKKRTIVTIIGILLSVALITAVSSMLFSFRESLIHFEKQNNGNYHYTFDNVQEEDLKYFKNNRNIEEYSITQDLGYALLPASKNAYKPYIFVKSYSKEALKNLAVNLIEGRMPKNDHEIIIPEHLKTNGRVEYQLHDKITLQIGNRISNGKILNQSNGYQEEEEETIDPIFEKEYEIVGIMERPSDTIEPLSAPGYTFITYLNQRQENTPVSVYVRYTKKGLTNRDNVTADLLNVDRNVYKKYTDPNIVIASPEEYNSLNEQMQKAKYTCKANDGLLRYEAAAFDDSTFRSLATVAGIVIVIIIVTSVFCIKNSFDISITEKTKQYGMLASVGATKKQIKKNVFYEAFILGIIGIPLGILCGLLASFILIKVSNLLLSDAFNLTLVYKFSYLAILFSILLGAITIYLSALKSARKASKISPINAIRNSDDIKIKAKKITSPKWIKKLFGIGGDIAYKNLKRNKKKYRTTVISIIVCVSVFIALSSFMSLAFRTLKIEYQEKTYNLSISIDQEENTDAQASEIDFTSFDSINRFVTQRSTTLSVENAKYSKEYQEILKANSIDQNEMEFIPIVSLSEEEYKHYIKEIGLNEEQAKNKAILMDTSIRYYVNGKNLKKKQLKLYTYTSGDTIQGTLEAADGKKKSLTIAIGKATEKIPMGLEYSFYSSGVLIVSDAYLNQYCEGYISNVETTYIDSSNPDQLQEELETELKNVTYSLENVDASLRMVRSFYTLVAIFLYGFITIIALIGITNIFNTITTNMELRSREFAMLKSIGMTKKEFNRMIRLESIFYGLKSLIIGIPIGIVLSYLIFRGLVSGSLEMRFEWPIGATVIASLAVFVLISCIMKYEMNKISKQNTIETIRNENI